MNITVTRKGFVVGSVAASLSLAACGSRATAPAATSSDPVEVRVASLKGPTSIGLVAFMDKASLEQTGLTNTYDFQVYGTADEVLPKDVSSVLYNKTQGAIQALDINTLGVLSIVTGDASVAEFTDLAGRTVYLTGKGTTPEYVMGYLLDRAGITDAVTLEFKSEAAEVVSALAADPSAVGILPEPYKTAALAKNDSLSSPVALSDVWDSLATDGSRMVTGVTIVRREFAENNAQTVEEFLAQQESSVDVVKADPATYAQSVVNHGIIDAAPVAEKAIPGCNLVCLTGDDMKAALSGYLDVLSQFDASSVGGTLPGDDFYYGV